MLIIAIVVLLLAVTPSIEKNYNYLADYIKFNRIVFIIFILGAYLAYNVLYVNALEDGVGIFGGVFRLTSLSQVFDIILCLIGATVIILTCFAPYNFRVYDDSNVMTQFMSEEHDLALSDKARSFKNDFLDYYFNKLFNMYLINDDMSNKSYIYTKIINILDKISNYIPNIEVKIPIILEKKLRYPKLEVKEFGFLLIYTIIGASLLITANNLVSLYLSLELQSFTLYILAASQVKSFKGTSGGLKYFLLGGLSSGFILLGCSLLYANTGTLNIEEIFYIYSDTSINYLLDPCLLILFAGLLFKVSAAPFHNWAPDVYSDVPTYTTTWLIVIAKVSIMLFMLLLVHNIQSALNLNTLNFLDQYYEVKENINKSDSDISNSIFSYNYDTSILNNFSSFIDICINIPYSFWNNSYSSLGLWTNILTISALLSLIIGTLVGLSQSRIKRLFAYSTIAHVGFLLLALSLNSISGIDAFIFYLIQYTITNLNLFFILIAWGYIYTRYYLEKEFVPLRFLYLNPLSIKEKFILPTIYDYGNFIKWDFIEKNNFKGYPNNNLKIYTVDNHLVYKNDNTFYDFDTEDTEWLYTPIPFLTNFKGMHYRDPFLAFCLSVTLLSLAGIPPMIGFFAKQQVLLAALQSDFIFVSIIVIFTSIIGAAYYLRIIKFIYFHDETFMPYYIANTINSNNSSNNNYNVYDYNIDFNNKASINTKNSVFIDNSTEYNESLPMLPSNSLSLIIALLTNISLFYIIKPYLLINLITSITLPLFVT